MRTLYIIFGVIWIVVSISVFTGHYMPSQTFISIWAVIIAFSMFRGDYDSRN